MFQPKSSYTALAFNTIKDYLEGKSIESLKKQKISDELKNKQACFVSIHTLNGDLRGCIGTIEPREKCLFFEIIDNAISAATRDPRFEPLTVAELNDITLSVDVLSTPVPIKNISELNPSIYGVIVSDKLYRRAVLLPNLEGIETVEQQLNIVKRKAGIISLSNNELEILKFTATRYH